MVYYGIGDEAVKKMHNTIYMIRSTENRNRYSGGGAHVENYWTSLRKAKLWKNRGALLKHIGLVKRIAPNIQCSDFEILEFLVETPKRIIPYNAFMLEVKNVADGA